MKIPKSFKLFGTTINVAWDNKRMNDMDAFGACSYSESEITLATKDRGLQISNDRVIETFYHERTHAILNSMQEYELSKNEKFVDIFSKLLRQAIETEEYDE